VDNGWGTGICGLVSAYLNSDSILLTDAHISDIIIQNIEQIPISLQDKIKTLQYNWDNDQVPELLSTENWDTILCSDVLYDSKYHEVLLRLISKLKFHRLLLSYKRRHDEQEKLFLTTLNDKYFIRLVNPDKIVLKNLNKASLSGLHLFVITPR
jgi:predicted nicotinamide N-methyase